MFEILLACHILVIGDSQAHSLQRPLAKQGKTMGFEVCKESKPGSAAYSWASDHMLGNQLRLHMPSLLVVSVGTNDAGGMICGSSPQPTRSKLSGWIAG